MLLSLLTASCSSHKRNANTIPWKTCQPNSEITQEEITEGNLKCATFAVPLDYSNPDGPKINLALIKRPASGPGNFIGTIITNPGGPGGSGVEDLAGSSTAEVFKGYFDHVSFDPRGIGLSEPFINCHTTQIDDDLNGANLTNFGSTPAYLNGLDQVITATTQIWGICEANFSNVLPFLGTQNVARDIEHIRIALGGEKINYIGYSYGTLIGATYAMLFPDNIRTMVLDGSLPAASTLYSQGIDSTQSYEATLDRMLSECDANPNCPLYGVSGGAEGVFNTLITNTNSGSGIPVSMPYGDLPPYLTPGWFITAVADGLAGNWSDLTEGMAEAFGLDGPADGSLLLAMGASSVGRSRDNTYDNSNEMYDIVQCNDFSDRPNASLVKALAYTVTTVDSVPLSPGIALTPNMGPYGVRISMPLCIGTSIPMLPPDPVPPIHSETTSPILVIGNITDPETPYIWGQSLSSAFTNSALLTWDGGFHTVFAEGVSECIDNATMDYLINTKLPPVGTVCPPTDPWAD